MSVALAACEPSTRSNVFVPQVFGPDADERRPTVASTAPQPAQGAAGARADAARRDARRGRTLTSPIIRLPRTPETATQVDLRPPVRIAADGTVTMSFERIGIPDFARAVFGEILQLDYTVAADLTGSVSLSVSQPVARSEVYEIAVRALAAAGVLVRRDGDLLIIEADPRGPVAGGAPVTVVVRRLEHVDQAQIEQALQPFLAPDARIAAGAAPGSLILAGSQDGVGALSNLVSALDIDPLSQRAFALFPLQMSPAAEVAEELRMIVGADRPGGPQVLEIERINAVLVVASSRDTIDEAQFWVRSLDRSETHDAQIHVYQAQNRRAAELAEVLQQAFSGGGGAIAAAAGLGADAGFTPAVAPGLTPVSLGEQGAAESETTVAPVQTLRRPRADSAGSDVTVFADEGTNSIMVVATPERYRVIEAALRQLDIQPVQVLIEATILEVTLNDQLQYGVRWFFESGDVSAGFSDFSSGAISPVFPGFNFVLDTSDVRTVVSALDAVSDLEVVSSPSLMVLNNETARLEVGDEVSIVTRTAQSVDGSPDAPLVNEVERRQTGVILQITPRVNASGVVLLDITQEVSTIGDAQPFGFPDIAQRRFESSVLLRDRETVALGGLIRNEKRAGKSGIPVLSDIPVIGALFGSTNKQADRTELLVVLRPVVIRNHAEAEAAYEELRSKLVGLTGLEQYLPVN